MDNIKMMRRDQIHEDLFEEIRNTADDSSSEDSESDSDSKPEIIGKKRKRETEEEPRKRIKLSCSNCDDEFGIDVTGVRVCVLCDEIFCKACVDGEIKEVNHDEEIPNIESQKEECQNSKCATFTCGCQKESHFEACEICDSKYCKNYCKMRSCGFCDIYQCNDCIQHCSCGFYFCGDLFCLENHECPDDDDL